MPLSALVAWAVWPWMAFYAPRGLSGERGSDLIVVLDGGATRLEQAERYRQQMLRQPSLDCQPLEPERLLIRCPRTLPPSQPMPQLLEGYDTVTQSIALAHWLGHRQAPDPRRVWIATDPGHTARATALARLALAGRGISVLPASPPPPGPQERRKLWRDLLRLSFWRLTGSTAEALAPETVKRKREACGL